jgi:hypothetical protein
MADIKITNLAASPGLAVGDLLVVVDVSDTTMSGAGTDVKATFTQVQTLLAPLMSYDLPMSIGGVLVVGAGVIPFIATRALTLVRVRAACGTAPTGASLKFDVNKNGTTMFTTQANRPEIAISGTSSSAATPDVTAIAAGDLITVDVDQVGSTIAGSNAVVVLEVY